MRDVAVVSFAQAPSRRRVPEANEVEILMPVVAEAVERSGVPREKIGFTCSGSCDYLAGQPFAFVWGLEAIAAWSPIRESHVEMDGAWALYAAVILAADDLARSVSQRPAWIKGIDHRIEPHALGARDLTTSESTAVAAERAGALDDKLDVVELLAPFTHQELILRDALNLKNG